MCIIVYKPKDVSFPSKSVLENCFQNNSDGAGYMFTNENKVVIKKGFMKFNDFWNSLEKSRKTVGDDKAFVMHFRITTQGGVKKHLCHPYPLSSKIDHLKWLKCKSDIGIAHNGIISLTSESGSYIYDSKTKKYTYSKKELDYNDTMKFITDYLSLIIKNKNYYKDKDTLSLIAKLCNSKLAILDGTGHCELIGDGWIKDKDCYYSNSSYLKSTAVYNGCLYPYSSYYSSDDDSFDEWEYYYNEYTKEYDFDESYCPNAIECLDNYCEMCANRHSCSLYKMSKGGE